MTVAEIIAKLQTLDPEAQVVVGVRQFTRRWSIACNVFDADSSYGGCAIWASLPENVHTVARQPK